MKIENLIFRAGANARSEPLTMEPGRITVFIGPNNGGKSASLREIYHSITTGNDQNSIFSEIRHSRLSQQEVEVLTEDFVFRGAPVTNAAHVLFGYRSERQELSLDYLRGLFNQPGSRPHSYAYTTFLKYFSLNLGGENRLQLVNSNGAQNLREKPLSTIAAIFLDNEMRRSISEIIFDAFGQYLVVDATTMGSLQYALASRYPSDDLSRSFGNDALRFFSQSTPIAAVSDGTKAFVGIITEVIAGNRDILVIDEPEAFLHPSLAYVLGREVARNISDTKQMFVSTHSSHFLMGCMSSGIPVDIVRLTYKSGEATARQLPATDLRRMMNDPLLRSIGVIGALFFEGAVVVEADSDRAFYEEINNRINLYGTGGIRHASFLNAHNKHEAAHITRYSEISEYPRQ